MAKSIEENQSRIESLKWLLVWSSRSWKNFFTVVSFTVISTTFAMVYSSWDIVRPQLAERILKPHINAKRFEEVGQRLNKNTNAGIISISLVNISADARKIAYYTVGGEHDMSVEGFDDTLFNETSAADNARTVRLIRGERYCAEYNPETTVLSSKAAVYNKIKYVCAISVPAGYSKEFLGIIAIGFEDKPRNEYHVLNELVIAASRLLE
jgi:hypothetical protein